MFCPLGAMKLGVQEKKLLHLIQPSQDPTYIYFTLYLQGPKSLWAQIWCGAFYIWGIDAFKFL